MNKNDFFQWLATDPGRMAVAGALGGIVRGLTLRESWSERVVSLLVGSICALYLGPIVSPIIEPFIKVVAPSGDILGFSSFVVGLSGITFSRLLIAVVAARRKEIEQGKDDDNG